MIPSNHYFIFIWQVSLADGATQQVQTATFSSETHALGFLPCLQWETKYMYMWRLESALVDVVVRESLGGV